MGEEAEYGNQYGKLVRMETGLDKRGYHTDHIGRPATESKVVPGPVGVSRSRDENQQMPAEAAFLLQEIPTPSERLRLQSCHEANNTAPKEQPSIGSLREDITRSSWDVEEAERRAFHQRLDQPSCTSLSMQRNRQLLSVQSLSTLSTKSTWDCSILDLTQGIPPKDMLEVVTHRLRLQDAQIEQEYAGSLSSSRLEAYYKLHARSAEVASKPLRPASRTVSAPHLALRSSLPNNESNHGQVEKVGGRTCRRSNQRLSSSSSQLSSIDEREPPVVRRHTKPSLESIASTGSTSWHHAPTERYTARALQRPFTNSVNDQIQGEVRRSTSATPLRQSSRSHNSMRTSSSTGTSSSKTHGQDRRTVASPYSREQENRGSRRSMLLASIS
jgi:hypothetical protein